MLRGFLKVNENLDTKLPERQTKASAGYDFSALKYYVEAENAGSTYNYGMKIEHEAIYNTAKVANAWSTPRTFKIDGAATSTTPQVDGSANVTLTINDLKEAYLSWGGKMIAGGVSPVDAAASSVHSANRFQFAKPNGIEIEYSRDSGSSWTKYTTTDADKINLVSGIGARYCIGGQEGTGKK